MQQISSVKDLRHAWSDIQWLLSRDFSALHRLTQDPVGTLRTLGYDLGPRAAQALQATLP